MSGEWARACDQWQVDGNPEIAALLIGRALWDLQYGSTVNNVRDVAQAGSAIRAWRKSLPHQWERVPDYDGSWKSDLDLLWVALHNIVKARALSPYTAEYLRAAEAMLRTWWKRQVQS